MITLLALSFAAPAEAANTPKVKNIRIREIAGYNVVATTSGTDTSVASIVAEVESDGGDESVTLVESDAWLHGAAALPALPKTEATVTLDVYDASNTLLASFTGTINGHGACTRMKRADFCGSGDATTTCTNGKLDLDVLAVDTFNAAKGYEAGFDLVGADTYTVAYATFVVTEGKTSTKAEVDWDDVGAVWEGALGSAPEGLVAVKATTYDSRGKKLDSAKVEVATPWVDGGTGVPALPTDEDPYTSLTVHDVKELADILKADYGIEPAALTVVSDGWNAGDTLPVDASAELTNGTTLSVPVNSYQITSLTTLSADFSEAVDTWFGKGGGDVTVVVESSDMLVIDSSGSISGPDYESEKQFGISGVGSGAAVVLTGAAFGDWELSASAFASTAAGLPTNLPLRVSLLDQKGNVIFTEDVDPSFDEEISVVFAYAVELAEDPIGLDLSGKVSLLGEANRKGKQETLSKGKFYGSFTRNDDGDLGLAGADKDAVSSKGDILIGGEPIDFELTDTNKDGVITGPPAIVFRTTGNGKGTRVVATTNTGSPGLL